MKYHFRRLTAANELAEYTRECRQRIGVELPADYVARSRIFALFGPTGAMMGGALLCTEGPFRSVLGLPREARTAIEASLPTSVFEGSGLWLDRSVRSPLWCLYFYLSLAIAVMRSGKRLALFTYATKVRTLNELYGLGGATTLYEGPVFCAGMKAAETERVCIVAVRQGSARFFLSPLLAPSWFFGRVFRRRLRRGEPALATSTDP